MTWGAPCWKVLCCLGQLFSCQSHCLPHSSPQFLHPQRTAAWRQQGTLIKHGSLPLRLGLCPTFCPCVRHRARLGWVRWQHLTHPYAAAPAAKAPLLLPPSPSPALFISPKPPLQRLRKTCRQLPSHPGSTVKALTGARQSAGGC